ncbi:hypothetical protein Acr_00g0080480 [Actinidia rufa]|uniref:DUF4283 domain-containing protein n=1 Tax=Actinidia rufa TaxID=165716 RepID=A0A7J0DU27_9ERIC|nr:hypothetical protein Acr_00g0080480 [Actinidia rufa]
MGKNKIKAKGSGSAPKSHNNKVSEVNEGPASQKSGLVAIAASNASTGKIDAPIGSSVGGGRAIASTSAEVVSESESLEDCSEGEEEDESVADSDETSRTLGEDDSDSTQGRFPGKKAIQQLVTSWKEKVSLHYHSSGWIVFKFDKLEGRDNVLQGGPYMVFGRPLLLKILPDYFSFNHEELSCISVWVQLKNLPLELWCEYALSRLCSKLGKPMFADKLTAHKHRISYARVLVEVDVAKPITQEIDIILPNGDSFQQGVFYENLPVFCTHCKTVSHSTKSCKVLEKFATARNKTQQANVFDMEQETNANTAQIDPQPSISAAGKNKGTQQEWVTKKSRVSDVQPSTKIATGTEHKKRQQQVHTSSGGPSLTQKKNPITTVRIPIATNKSAVKGQEKTHPIPSIPNPVLPIAKGIEGRTKKSKKNLDKHGTATSNADLSADIGDDSPAPPRRRPLWDNLRRFSTSVDKPWILLGDFNNVLSNNEKSNGLPVTEYEIRDFKNCCYDLGISDLRSSGVFYTWSNNSVWCKLDRTMVNNNWVQDGILAQAVYELPGKFSDHSSCTISLLEENDKGATPFKFYNMWSKHESFLEVVSNSWNLRMMGIRMYKLCRKLKAVKEPLKILNRKHFTHISAKEEAAEEELVQAQQQLHNNTSDTSLQNLVSELRMRALKLSEAEISYYSQVAKAKFLKNSDKGTKFFHDLIRANCSKNHIASISLEDGSRSSSGKQVSEAFVHYYKGLLGTTQRCSTLDRSIALRGKLLEPEQAANLMREVSGEEIKATLFSIGEDKAPGPDGYLGIPVADSRLSIPQFRPLIDKIAGYISAWAGANLSYAGWTELVKSVLQGVECFWLSILPIPTGVRSKIVQLCRNFLWSGNCYSNKKPLVAWKVVTLPKSEGGLGIRNSSAWNKALLLKTMWDIQRKKDSLWVQWIHQIYMKNRSFWDYLPKHEDSPLIKQVIALREEMVAAEHSVDGAIQRMNQWTENGQLHSRLAYDYFRPKSAKLTWPKLVWHSSIIPKHSFILWLGLRDRLLTKDKLQDFIEDPSCPLCRVANELTDHLFF